jgi:ABC-2 type transport system ATP-binding protein
VGLVAALASHVELLVLDEPTSGLDPLMAEVFQQCINEERRRGRTVLLSSHVLAEVEALCDRVTIIRLGRTVETGALSDMRHLTRTSIAADLAAEPNGLGSLEGVHNLQVEGTRVHFEADTSRLDAVLRQLTSIGVRSLVSQPPTLEELFLRHYQDDLSNGRRAETAVLS